MENNEITTIFRDEKMEEIELICGSKKFNAVCHICRTKMDWEMYTLDEKEKETDKTFFQRFINFGAPICEDCRKKMLEIAGSQEKFDELMYAIWKPVNDAYHKAYLATNLFCVVPEEKKNENCIS